MFISSFTTSGLREQNQDAIFPPPDAPDEGIYLVADGLGGHANGERASFLARDWLVQRLREGDPARFVVNAAGMADEEITRAFLVDIFRQASAGVRQEAHRMGSDMATTCTLAWLRGERLTLAHCGDCAAFLLPAPGAQPQLLTQPQRCGSKLTQALGQEETVTPNVTSFQFCNTMALVIGCDGFWEYTTHADLMYILDNSLPYEMAEKLVARALENGSDDNVSVVVAAGSSYIEPNLLPNLAGAIRAAHALHGEERATALRHLQDFARRFAGRLDVADLWRMSGMTAEFGDLSPTPRPGGQRSSFLLALAQVWKHYPAEFQQAIPAALRSEIEQAVRQQPRK